MIGTILFYILWPLVWVYAPLTRRVRVVVIHDDKILLVKNRFGPGAWQLPGGGIKVGESVFDAGVREIQEELDVRVKPIRELHKGFVVHRQFGLLMRYHFVTAEIIDPKKQLEISKELQCAEWMSVKGIRGAAPEVARGLRLSSEV